MNAGLMHKIAMVAYGGGFASEAMLLSFLQEADADAGSIVGE